MTTTGFTITGQAQLNARLTAIGRAPREMLREIGIRGVSEAKRIHRPHRKTGNLDRTIRAGTLTDTYVEIRAGGQNKVGYAAVHEFGSVGGQEIVPKRARVLAWGGPRTLGGRLRKGGRATNFAMHVTRGATRAFPYLTPGLESALKLAGLDGLVNRWNAAG